VDSSTLLMAQLASAMRGIGTVPAAGGPLVYASNMGGMGDVMSRQLAGGRPQELQRFEPYLEPMRRFPEYDRADRGYDRTYRDDRRSSRDDRRYDRGDRYDRDDGAYHSPRRSNWSHRGY